MLHISHSRGIYSTPQVAVAEQFATQFEVDGQKYLVLLQNRVNPAALQRVAVPGGEYLVSKTQNDIRPYGEALRSLTHSLAHSKVRRAHPSRELIVCLMGGFPNYFCLISLRSLNVAFETGRGLPQKKKK